VSPTRRIGGRVLAKMYFVYILQSNRDKKLYTGRTENIESRLEEHNLGKVKSTKNRKPLELIYYEAYKDKQDAVDRELFLKSGRGREVIRKQLKNSISR
jgi:putative endonuclease